MILCAGVYGSPQLLMLSGVGPAGHLREHGIDVLADLPVGDNLHDHMFVPMTYCMTSARNRGTTPYFAGGVIKEAVRGDTWMGRTVFEAVGFVRSPQARDIPDIQVHALPWSYPFPNQDSPARQKVDKRCALTIMPTLIYPKSRGTLRLASADPAAAPVIDPGYLTEPDDSRLLLDGIELIRETMASHAHRRPGQPGAEPRLRLPRPGRAGRRAAEPRDLGVPRGGHLPDGHGRAGGGGSGAAGPRHRRAPGRRRVDHAQHHRREHQRPRHDDRRARRPAHEAGLISPSP